MMFSCNNAEEGIGTQHDSHLVRKIEANSRCAVRKAKHSGIGMRHSHGSVEIQSGRQPIRAVPATSFFFLFCFVLFCFVLILFYF